MKFLMEILFPTPKQCPICGEKQMQPGICITCYGKAVYERSSYGQCKHCGKFGTFSSYCDNCRGWNTALYDCQSVWPYTEPYQDVIWRLKFRGEPWLASILAHEMRPLLSKNVDLLVPVPIHKTRLAERGYNQSSLLAKALAEETGIPYCEAISRTKKTKHQTMLHKNERRVNLKDAFTVINQEVVFGKRIVLVDDIVTTGATLEACAIALQKAGAKQIRGIVLASGAMGIMRNGS